MALARAVGAVVGCRDMDVVRLRWPEETNRRRVLRAGGVPRLLLVADGALPPDDVDVLEDWARASATEIDLAARAESLWRRAARLPPPPCFDDDGLLRYGRHLVILSPLETRVAQVLVARMGELVDTSSVAEAGWPEGAPTPSTMTTAMRRLRRRLRPAGLLLTVVTARGWMLEAQLSPS